jgi:protocatechuate 3,4-dioxygenase, alpha subunit
MSSRETPSQTVGPFFAMALPWEGGAEAVDPSTPGALRIGGRVLDGAGEPVPDALVETWQAGPAGGFDHPDDPRGAAATPGFRGFSRYATDADGRWAVVTLRPGPLPAPDGGTEAPHLDVSLFARGLLTRLVTRIYLPDEGEANAADPVLRSIPDAAARATLVAVAEGEGRLRFDIRLQGEDETVFFDV